VRALASEGKFPGATRDPESGEWRIPQWAVHERLQNTRAAPVGDERPLEDAERAAELEAEVRDLRYRLGQAEGRLELTEVAQSTLQESLQRERERADRLEEEARELRERLLREQRSWWRRLFRS
jgi:chromosome segregation ATPase